MSINPCSLDILVSIESTDFSTQRRHALSSISATGHHASFARCAIARPILEATLRSVLRSDFVERTVERAHELPPRLAEQCRDRNTLRANHLAEATIKSLT
jgi:hypothetical protein